MKCVGSVDFLGSSGFGKPVAVDYKTCYTGFGSVGEDWCAQTDTDFQVCSCHWRRICKSAWLRIPQWGSRITDRFCPLGRVEVNYYSEKFDDINRLVLLIHLARWNRASKFDQTFTNNLCKNSHWFTVDLTCDKKTLPLVFLVGVCLFTRWRQCLFQYAICNCQCTCIMI